MNPLADASPRRLRRPLCGLLAAALLGAGLTTHAEPAAEPYLRLRETTAGYHGAAEDFTHLTEIRIGWFGPSDPADPLNGDFWWAANLAVREANDQCSTAAPASFAALPIRLVPRWAPDPWRAGVSLLARMVYDEQPLALLGSIDSASTHLAEQVVAKANLPLVSPIATDKTATLAGVSWMFSCAPDDTAVARALVDDLQRNLSDNPKSKIQNRKSIVLLATTDHESRMTAREVSRELSRSGLLPEFRFDLPPGTADATEPLRSVAGAHPAAVIVIADAPDSARITRAVHEQLGAVPVFGGSPMGRTGFIELAGPAAEGVRFPLLFAPDAADSSAAAFTARFVAERHHAPDYAAALAYDATRLLIEAVRRAGPNRARIREALVQLSPWSGIAGHIAFDGTGQNRRADLRLGTIRQGAMVVDSAPAPAATPLRSVSTP
jgi:branched-chain amino acid transport system substrate-binding protein